MQQKRYTETASVHIAKMINVKWNYSNTQKMGAETIKCLNCKIDKNKIEQEAMQREIDRKFDKLMKSIEYRGARKNV